jgi:superfamily II DNA/RNA helicase
MALRDAKTLVFCQTKRRVDEMYRLTKQIGFPVVSLTKNKKNDKQSFYS